MIDAATRLYCLFGNPARHSKGPVIHNAAFKDKDINAVYLAFEVQDAAGAAQAVRTLDIQGASVTIPFKESIMEHIDWIDPTAKAIGAVNTIVNENGVLKGYNTDCQAAVAPLVPFGISGKTVCIVGAGGAARAVAHGIAAQNGDIIITNRTEQKGRALAETVNARFIPAEEMENIQADVIINTTSIGMTPKENEISFPPEALRSEMVVMDVVYTPLRTRLLEAAEQKGCTTIDGLSMFIAQAAAQFELWTGIIPDTDLMRNTIIND
ncbi:shikimate dehydrogenase [Desulfobacter postgatei]|jgi:shikimate dehydrogenase|uniref:shikimate dehydrogenase n=1 Tax=Desulfobacter postgatei TaxID=2293 RepID=UPI002A36A489|nr:shikimate dehydrogenase [Desulfobacter postgatei]MDX9964686.1 shikimate dehydrogenase [Desulfobacter postgatei]